MIVLPTALRTLALACLLVVSVPSMAIELRGNEVSVGAHDVQPYLDASFPQHFDALGGLFTLTAREPSLSIPEQGQRLQLSFAAAASSPGNGEVQVGRIMMSSQLRYDSTRHALYLEQPTLDDMQPAVPGQRLDPQTRMLVNLWLAEYAGLAPLYRLQPEAVEMLGSIKVESTRIEQGRIVLTLNQAIGYGMPALE